MDKLTEASGKILFTIIGKVLSKLKMHEEALKHFKQVLVTNNQCIYTLLRCGETLSKMNRDEEALKYFNQALLYNYTHIPLYIKKLNSLNKLGKYKESLKCCKQGLSFSPYNRQLLEAKEMSILGLQSEWEIKIDDNLSNAENELEKLEKKLEAAPNCAYTYKCKGNILSKLGRNEEAITEYKKSIELEPDYIVAYFSYGDTLLKIGRDEEAILTYDKAILLRPTEALGYVHKGNALVKLKKFEEALKVFEKGIKACEIKVLLQDCKGNTLNKMGKFTEALTVYDKLLTLNPKNVSWYISKGDILKNLERYEEAVGVYNKALEQEPHSIEAISSKALVVSKIGKHKEALELVQKALSLESTNVNISIKTGHAFYEMGDYKEAINAYDKAIKLGDDDNQTALKLKNNALGELSKVAREEDMPYLIENIPLSLSAKLNAKKHLNTLALMNDSNNEKADHLQYLQNLLRLPWGKSDNVNIDLNKAAETLEKEHYGLEEVKNRILESLVFMARSSFAKPPIICLVGAPGVGKTSIATSIANSLGRKCALLSLAGANDSSVVRGCMKFYRGATPSKVLTLISESGVCNPVMVLDEIDKIDCSSRNTNLEGALLQLVDPSQNDNFTDDYFDFPFDMSKVLFIVTANSLAKISYPLINRMEIIEISGYLDEEKLQIAQNYIMPKLLKEANLSNADLNLDKEIIFYLIKHYTKESGVRDIERLLRELIQKYLLEKVRGKNPAINIKLIEQYFSSPEYNIEGRSDELEVGSACGLSWTAYGGRVTIIEAEKYPGDGKIKTTGKLGEVLKESVEAAYGYLKSHYKELDIKEDAFKNYDLHLHYPELAIGKEGPSSGITIYTAIASLLTGKKVNPNIAMTGEITLKGKVLPIGGLKEKLAAAVRENKSFVIIPEGNKRDLAKIPDEIKNALTIKTISYAKELLDIVFV